MLETHHLTHSLLGTLLFYTMDTIKIKENNNHILQNKIPNEKENQ